jgi:hypothetical protein
MFQILRSVDGTITLSGRIEGEEELLALETFLESHARPVVLDLADLRLVHREAVKFLLKCEDSGIELRNCPSYVRNWIDKRKRSTA